MIEVVDYGTASVVIDSLFGNSRWRVHIIQYALHVHTRTACVSIHKIGLQALSLPASFCVSVCVYINHLLVRAMTQLGSRNLDQMCKTPWLKPLCFLSFFFPLFICLIILGSTLTVMVELNFKVKFCPNLNLKFARAKTHHSFKLGSPNLDQKCKTAWSRSLYGLRQYQYQYQDDPPPPPSHNSWLNIAVPYLHNLLKS